MQLLPDVKSKVASNLLSSVQTARFAPAEKTGDFRKLIGGTTVPGGKDIGFAEGKLAGLVMEGMIRSMLPKDGLAHSESALASGYWISMLSAAIADKLVESGNHDLKLGKS